MAERLLCMAGGVLSWSQKAVDEVHMRALTAIQIFALHSLVMPESICCCSCAHPCLDNVPASVFAKGPWAQCIRQVCIYSGSVRLPQL